MISSIMVWEILNALPCKLNNGLRNPEHTALFQPEIQTGDEDKL